MFRKFVPWESVGLEAWNSIKICDKRWEKSWYQETLKSSILFYSKITHRKQSENTSLSHSENPAINIGAWCQEDSDHNCFQWLLGEATRKTWMIVNPWSPSGLEAPCFIWLWWDSSHNSCRSPLLLCLPSRDTIKELFSSNCNHNFFALPCFLVFCFFLISLMANGV